MIDRADLLDDIKMELAIAQRTYHAEVLLMEVIEEDLVRVCYRSNRALDQVRDRLEAGEAFSSDPSMEGGNRWRVVQVGEDESEEAVLYLAGKGGDGLHPGQPLSAVRRELQPESTRNSGTQSSIFQSQYR